MQHKTDSAGLVSLGAGGEHMQKADIMRKAKKFADPKHFKIVLIV
jgi:hypothetical protein